MSGKPTQINGITPEDDEVVVQYYKIDKNNKVAGLKDEKIMSYDDFIKSDGDPGKVKYALGKLKWYHRAGIALGGIAAFFGMVRLAGFIYTRMGKK